MGALHRTSSQLCGRQPTLISSMVQVRGLGGDWRGGMRDLTIREVTLPTYDCPPVVVQGVLGVRDDQV